MSEQSSSDGKRQVVITAHLEAMLDPERVEEYVRATFKDGDQVQIQDVKSGETYYDNIGCESLFPGAGGSKGANGGEAGE